MPSEQSPRRVYEQYLKDAATFDDVESAAQGAMDRFTDMVRSRDAADVTQRGT